METVVTIRYGEGFAGRALLTPQQAASLRRQLRYRQLRQILRRNHRRYCRRLDETNEATEQCRQEVLERESAS